jgi:hypothetical protein
MKHRQTGNIKKVPNSESEWIVNNISELTIRAAPRRISYAGRGVTLFGSIIDIV